MTLKNLARTLTIASLMLTAAAPVAMADDKPLPMRTEGAIVYATPITSMVILEFKLYDNKTWCRLYIRKEAWELAKANGGELPPEIDPGQLECERR